MRHLYSTVFRLLLPLVFLRLLWRSRAAPDYRRRWVERLGFASASARRTSDSVAGEGVIWLHAVSLGETLAARPLVESLLQGFPGVAILVTTTTPTGSAQVRSLFGDRVLHVYMPLDTPGALRRFLGRYRPRLLILMETELWPNLLHACAQRQCPVLLANARLSQRSFRGYRRLGRFGRDMFSAISHVACQSGDDARRFAALGLPPERLSVCGNIKYDLDLGAGVQARIAQLKAQWQCTERLVFVAASTHEGEDEAVLAAFSALREQVPRALLVLVPRHPERFKAVHKLCLEAGWQTCRRSLGESPDATTAVLLGDTLGELLVLLGSADVAFIGGSLVPRGGHNLVEPAALGVPVLSGPSLFNFAAVADALRTAGALLEVGSATELGTALCDLARDADRRAAMGQAARAVALENRGARQGIERLVRQLLAPVG